MSYLFQLWNIVSNPKVYIMFISLAIALTLVKLRFGIIAGLIIILLGIFLGYVFNIYPLWLFLLFIFVFITFGYERLR